MQDCFRVGVTGASGMLGTALLDHLSAEFDVYATSRVRGYQKAGVTWDAFDMLEERPLRVWLETRRPDVVIHGAALVNVDGCERRPEEARALHCDATRLIGRVLAGWSGRLVYISTDAVFDGRKQGPYLEEDEPHPGNVYARTKLQGETAVLESQAAAVLRTNIFGWTRRAQRPSFAEWVLRGLVEQKRLTMFTDVCYTPIHVSHLAVTISALLKTDLHGLFHAGGGTVLSKYDFARRMAEVFGLDASIVVPSSIDDAGLAAARPKNMALSSRKLGDALHLAPPGVDEGITLLKNQYDGGWLNAVKGHPPARGYRFWESHE